MTKQEREDFVKKMFEPTIDNAIRDMRISKSLFLTKDNKFYSSIANELFSFENSIFFSLWFRFH